MGGTIGAAAWDVKKYLLLTRTYAKNFKGASGWVNATLGHAPMT
jgi:hypothetical protein